MMGFGRIWWGWGKIGWRWVENGGVEVEILVEYGGVERDLMGWGWDWNVLKRVHKFPLLSE